jgi:adenylate cyclase
MAIEIERKFLLANDGWRAGVSHSVYMSQAYLGGSRCSTRVRIAGDLAWLNIKSLDRGSARLEFEYAIPASDARQLIAQLADGPAVSKTRHHVPIGDHIFEIDEFSGDNAGLIVAEIELERIDEPFPRPDWLGAEVTHDDRYYNVRLAQTPYSTWAI